MRLPVLVVATVLVAACSSGTTPARPGITPGITKVLTVILENHGTKAALDGMPYLASLAESYGRTTAYRALTHPSLPNYLALAGGSTFDVLDDDPPDAHPIGKPSVFDAALTAGHTAGTFAEAMAEPCQQDDTGTYAVRHNPWAYFSSARSRAGCTEHDLPMTGLPEAIRSAALPDVGLLVPDLCHDAHDCGLDVADGWLRTQVGDVLAGPDYRAGHLAVVVTFDEDEGTGDAGSDILTVVVAPRVRKRVVDVPLDHRSWCRWMTDLVGAPPLADATSLGRAFGL